jgi:hypothetical protein
MDDDVATRKGLSFARALHFFGFEVDLAAKNYCKCLLVENEPFVRFGNSGST